MAETFKLIGQQQTSEINPGGTGFMEVWNVTAQVTSGPAKGTNFTVQVPSDEHNAETVGKMLAAKVVDLSAIAALGG